MDPKLNLPNISLSIKEDKVWDMLRKKYVKLTPEEWVRQHFIHYLIQSGYSKNLMQSEQLVRYNMMSKRCDILVSDNAGAPCLIVECKAPTIKLNEDTFYQIAKYYHVLRAPLLVLTNGLEHIYAILNPKNNKISYLKELPSKQELESLINDF